MNEKLWYTSRELWVAIATGLAGVFTVIATQYPTIGWVAIVKAILDGLLRVTSTGLPIGGRLGRLGRRLSGKE